METVLSIAGSDPSAGAGIQQDIKTITAMGCYGATVITALTSQNTMGVQGVMAVPCEVVGSQLSSVFDDLDVRAVKIGQIPNQEVAEIIVRTLEQHPAAKGLPVVYDPVMISSSGHRLMEQDCMEYVRQRLMRICSLVTPNIPETEVLLSRSLITFDDLDLAGHELSSLYHTAFLLKGGHAGAEDMVDRLYLPCGESRCFGGKRVDSFNLHGTGCTLSSAIASALALGYDLSQAVEKGKNLVTAAIRGGKDLHIGHGNGPLWPFEH